MIRRLARPLLALVFLSGGASALRAPAPRVELVRKAGLREPERLVRVNALVHLVAGLGLASGRLPRLCAALLAGSLVPTTYVGHPFWAAGPDARAQQRLHFAKNMSTLGGLLLVVADTGGRESLPHRLARLSRRGARSADRAARAATRRAG